MNNAIFRFERPHNEPVLDYLPHSSEWAALSSELQRQSETELEIPLIIAGEEIKTGNMGRVVLPHDHHHVLATYHKATPETTRKAIQAALDAKEEWMTLSWVERASIFLKAAELVSKKYRFVLNASTMLGQGKNVFQAEIDSACEVVDYLRFLVHSATQIYEGQPLQGKDTVNRVEYRPLEGFVYAISPFNFTAIACNLPVSTALMGNTVVWKPASTAVLSNYYLMKIYEEAGLPKGVINFVPGSGSEISRVVLSHPDMASIHFTGSTSTFQELWQGIGSRISQYRNYPRLVGETGGKDFVFAHPSADPKTLAVAILRGAFEYQGQKCSATSRGYIPRSLWPTVRDFLLEGLSSMKVGDPCDPECFINAVIDEAAFDSILSYIEKAKASGTTKVLYGGTGDKSKGYFIQPTLLETTDPHSITMEEEIFGPVMTVYVYEDQDFEETLRLCDKTSPYVLTGSFFGKDRYTMMQACRALRYSAGVFYFNDKTTGAMVGQQPFGGSRASGTNDKAGTVLNLLRWVSPRAIKENLTPPQEWRYPYML